MIKPELPGRLTKEYINSLPVIRYQGSITIITDPAELDMLDTVPAGTLTGFDTETRPAFTRGETHSVALIQISVPDTVILIQVKKTGIPEALVKFFENEKILKTGVAIKEDLHKLQEIKEFKPAGFIDLAEIASSMGIVQTGVRGLAARYLQGRISKTAQTSNWERKFLTDKQQSYAATDAWVCTQIYPLLTADTTDYHLPE